MPLKDKIAVFSVLRQNFGRSALLLSGGATLGFASLLASFLFSRFGGEGTVRNKKKFARPAIGLYHLGVIKALFEHNLLPRIFSGSSAGSLFASLVCCKNDEELPKIFKPSGLNLEVNLPFFFFFFFFFFFIKLSL